MLVERGAIEPAIDRVMPLEKIREAHKIMENREHFGKIIIRP